MNSTSYIEQLKAIDCSAEFSAKHPNLKSLLKDSERMKKEGIAIEIGVATELALLTVFENFNVDDGIFAAYAAQYPQLSESQSLYDALLAKGDSDISAESLRGFISGIKGKAFELELNSHLNAEFDGWEFSLAESATQPIWDIKGVNAAGEEILIQPKMGNADYASDVQSRMLDNPDVYFITSNEIQDKILTNHPELQTQFIDFDASNAEFTTHIIENVEQLITNHGIDIWDGAGDYLPMIGEVVLGVKLLLEISSVNQEYSHIDKSHQNKIKMLKAAMYLSRYGVTTTLTTATVKAGAAMGLKVDMLSGGLFAGLGTLFGTMAGLGAGFMLSSNINNKIKPHLYDMTLGILDYTRDDMFYFNNKSNIDAIGKRLRETYQQLAAPTKQLAAPSAYV